MSKGVYVKMKIQFYQFNKRLNSTSIPEGSGTEIDVKLLEPSSIEAPSIILKDGKNLNFNYCCIPIFNRYYWIVSRTILDNDRVRYSLQVDVLASFRDDIETFKSLMIRCPSIDHNVFDTQWYPSINPSIVGLQNIDIGLSQGGTYVMYASNDVESANDINPTQVAYAMDSSTLRSVCSQLFNKSNYGSGSGTEVLMDITQQTICNPLQYITKVIWFPFELSGDSVDMKVGWIAVPAAGSGDIRRLSASQKKFAGSFKIHGNTEAYYLDDRTAQYYIYVPGCGVQSIPPCYSNKELSYNIYVDLLTGATNTEILYQGTIIISMTGSMGYSVPLSAVNYEIPPVTVAIARAASTAYTGLNNAMNSFPNSIADIPGFFLNNSLFPGSPIDSILPGSSIAINAFESLTGKDTAIHDLAAPSSFADDLKRNVLQPTPNTIGGYSDRTFIKSEPNIRLAGLVNKPVIEDFSGTCGFACHKIGKVSEKGYYQFASGDISCNASISERQQLSSFMKGGIWYE